MSREELQYKINELKQKNLSPEGIKMVEDLESILNNFCNDIVKS